MADEVSSKLHTTELVGPDGHIQADRVRVELLVSDIETDYPMSVHAVEETYLVIAGVAEWAVGDTNFMQRAPGDFVHHPA